MFAFGEGLSYTSFGKQRNKNVTAHQADQQLAYRMDRFPD